jgi:FkbM family methyltransferase
MLRSTGLLNLFSGMREVAGGYGAGLKLIPMKGDREITLGAYEIPVQKALIENAQPGGVVYDVGANVGYFSLLAARRVGPEGRVYAFEPVARNAAAIERSARANGFHAVEVFEKAVGAADGAADLNLARHIGGAMLASVGTPPDWRATVEVEVVALDGFIDVLGLRPPSLVKIDVEGAELDVLRGLTRTIEAHSPIMIIEIDDANEAGLQSKARDLSAALAGLGYDATLLAPSYPDAEWSVAHFLATPRGSAR